MRDVLIYGSGGFAREVAWLLECCELAGKPLRAVGFVDDDQASVGADINGLKVWSLQAAAERFRGAAIAVGVGGPSVRERLADRALALGLSEVTIVHPRVEASRFVEYGLGTVVCAGTILTTNIRLGRQVQVNLDCTVGHDVVMEDFVTLAPGVHVSGWVRIERGAYIGTGASIINGTAQAPLVIGAGAVVGAGACVTNSIPAGVTAVGVPARPKGAGKER